MFPFEKQLRGFQVAKGDQPLMIQPQHPSASKKPKDKDRNDSAGCQPAWPPISDRRVAIGACQADPHWRRVQPGDPEPVSAATAAMFVRASHRRDRAVERAYRIRRNRGIMKRVLRRHNKGVPAVMAGNRHAEIPAHGVRQSDKGPAVRAAKLHPETSSAVRTADRMPSPY